MGPKAFAEACKEERDTMLALYADTTGGSAVSEHLRAASLSDDQRKHVLAALNGALTDAFYTMLLALDGSASLGGRQHSFQLRGEDGAPIASGDGRLEAAAWNALQEDDS
jgi:hypothetical protein